MNRCIADFEVSVITPAGPPEPSLAIAACRAGALGILNLEFSGDRSASLEALAKLATSGRGRFGVQLDGDDEGLLAAILERGDPNLSVIVVANARTNTLAAIAGSIRGAGRLAYLVATDLDRAKAGEAAGFDAIVVKGHESGGWVGEETSFVLLQRLIPNLGVPVVVQGGIGLHTAGACFAAGAAGVVLDAQLLLTKESPLPDAVKSRIASMDGSETACFGSAYRAPFRCYSRPNLPGVDAIRKLEVPIANETRTAEAVRSAWREDVGKRVDWRDATAHVLAIGQDAAFAASLAKRFGTVGGVLAGLRESIRRHCEGARLANPIAEGSPLAESHGTKYPIVQGPMTRVSDRAEFALAVAEGGGLPFLALALLRGKEVEVLLKETHALLGDRPWGVGLLGFVPQALRDEQLAAVRANKPPHAIIAGGRPEQAKGLEADGIRTYLHVPSPGLLKMFLQEGSARFIFEGRECGGHIGPRTSFVLWESMVDVILDHLGTGGDASKYHVLFAGGVHDGLSAAMVATLAAPLTERGVKVGVLIGTAYLFTEEAVSSGAIVPKFQEAAVACEETAVLESGPGNVTRCAPSPFVAAFAEEKHRLQRSGLSAEDLKNELEVLNIGRLRVASKGLDRNPLYSKETPDVPKLVDVDADGQWANGMYMIGQVAALRADVCSIASLHDQISNGSSERLADLASPTRVEEAPPKSAAIAIVGMGTILPGAPDLQTYWANILNKVDAITEVPASRWNWRDYFDPDRSAKDKVYSRWGGFVDDVPFDPVTYGIPPGNLKSIEPFQLLALAVVRAALTDAGYMDRPFPKERTSVILGAGGGGADLTAGYMVRSSLPHLLGEEGGKDLTENLGVTLPEWTEDSFAGILMNVAAGRVANRFDLGGVNYTVDAACASSLAAVYLAVRDLEARTSDVVIVGGVDAIQNPFAFLCFSKTQALSPTGRCRTFDEQGDGIAISEGFAALVLKRLDDAERDGDRIYGVIRGAGGSSDGRDRSLTAPRPEGQARALERAYAQSNFPPATVGLIEAHGTGTVAGDMAEVRALSLFFGRTGAETQACAIGSVKSMIGHAKAAAGVAGLIKATLALHHRVLPPTLGVTRPNPKAKFAESPFYVNSEARPWVGRADGLPRRAGVSAFGFGGTNFHISVEEYTGDFLPRPDAVLDSWPAEMLLWRGSRAEILKSVSAMLGQLEKGVKPRLADLSLSTCKAAGPAVAGKKTLAIVATSIDDLVEKLGAAKTLLEGKTTRQQGPGGIHFSETPLAEAGKVAFLFPGQGSQYVNMGRDIALVFPEARAAFEKADRVLSGRLGRPLSRIVFPPPAFEDDEVRRQKAALMETDAAQSALGATELAYLHVLRSLGVEPGMAAGHSYGEFAALHAAGCLDEETLLSVSEARGRFIKEGTTEESGTMAAVDAGVEALKPLAEIPGLTLANLNAPSQTVLSGTRAAVEKAIAWCESKGMQARKIPVACAFHSPLMAPAQKTLGAMLRELPIRSPSLTVFSNTTASAYPAEPSAMVDLLADHLVRPVEFVREVEAMYEAGARIFVEVGPGRVLSGLVGRILVDRPHACVPLDHPGRPGIPALLDGLATLAAEGVDFRPARLFQGRSARAIDLSRLEKEAAKPALSPTTWLVNGGSARPIREDGGAIKPRPEPPKIQVLNGPSKPTSRAPEPPAIAEAPQPPARTIATSPAHAIPNGDRGVSARPGVQPRRVNPPRTEEPKVVTQTAYPDHGVARHAPAAAPHRPAAATLPPDIIRQFQQVMQQFLTTQQATMQNLLHAFYGNPGSLAPAPMHEPSNGNYAAPPTFAAPVHHEPAEPHFYAPATNGGSLRSGLAGVSIPLPMELPRASAPMPSPVVHHQPAPPAPVVQQPAPVKLAPVVPQVVAAPTPAPAASALPTRDELTAKLLDVVSERTGYPAEMLALDVDLEADLGIDSIKRVEIAGTIVRSLDWPASGPPDPERLTASRTLREVIDTLASMLGLDGEPAMAGASIGEENGHPFDGGRSTTGIGRYEPEPVVAPPITNRGELSRTGVVVIVDDGAGVGESLAALLSARGHRAVRVVSGPASGAGDVVSAEIGRPEEVTRLVALLRERFGSASALIHLAALRPGDDALGMDAGAWMARLSVDLRGLFLLSQALRTDLERAATTGGAAVLGATTLGGAFGVDGFGPAFFPGQGAVAGFLKTLAQEWPSIRVKAVDLAPAEPSTIAAHLLDELTAADGLVEVGYRDGERTTLRLSAVPLEARDAAEPLDRDSVVLITGGARGITAEAAIRIAEKYHSTLVLVGRTAPPSAPEAAETAALTDPKALRQAIIARYKARGQVPKPIAVEDDYRRLLREREVRDTLDRITKSGSKVECLTCDVRDVAALTACVEQTYRTFGRIDGVIHGAGVIEDKLVKDKGLDSFDRVVETKVHGALALASSLRAESLKFLVLFSSISGRFGNRGQGDYAAANEILNKLAQDLDRRWPGRVVAINWGPWQTAGMASPDVLRQFAERGISLIEVEDGCRRLLDEIRLGRKGDVEVLIGGAMSTAMPDGPSPPPATARPLPMLAKGAVVSLDAGRLEVARTLDLRHDLYLDDHRIDDKPVLPFAVAMELMAEAASAARPGSRLVVLRDIRLMRGVSLENDEPKPLKVAARPASASDVPSGCEALEVVVSSAESPPRLHYRALALLEKGTIADSLAPGPIRPLGEAGPLPLRLDEAYREWLFHGPIFQGIVSVDAIGAGGSSAILRTSSPGDCLAAADGSWLVDPVLVDCAFQVQLFWARLHWDITLLPSLVKDFRRVADAAGSPRGGSRLIRHEMRIGPANQAPMCQADHYFFEEDGRLLACLSGCEAVGSKALNRLAVGGRR